MPKKVLYVDDEKINLDLFRLTFRKKVEVVVASSGSEGMECIKNDKDIGLVISDMKMPVMTGLEFISEIKQVNGDLPCALLSGYDICQDIKTALEDGVISNYFRKPFDKKQVEEVILNAVL